VDDDVGSRGFFSSAGYHRGIITSACVDNMAGRRIRKCVERATVRVRNKRREEFIQNKLLTHLR
jgi:hypothetical protein